MAVRKIERGHYFEDFEVGHLFQHHWGRTITDGDNSFFSSVTMNANPAYFNREYARSLGYEEMKYLATVYPGDTLASQSLVLEKRDTSRPDRGVVKFRTTGFNQRGEKVLEYERPVLIRKRNVKAG